MFAHHNVAILVISMSWSSHFHRIGSLVLVYHDFADIFLEAAKITKYAKYHRSCDIITALFALAWIVSRMIFYPRLVYCCVTKSLRSSRTTVLSQIQIGLLVLLQCFHIVWTYMIFTFAYNALKVGTVHNDYRSDSGSGDSANELECRKMECRGKKH